MSQEELRRVEVLARVLSGQLRVVDASRLLGVSYRQTKRLWKRYREEGPASLKHPSVGCTSNRAYAPKFRQRVLDRRTATPISCNNVIGQRASSVNGNVAALARFILG
jgi:transposase-like protein